MRKLFSLLVFIIIHNHINGQTQLCLLGTVHKVTEKINSNTILDAFTLFEPDIILYEADTILNIRQSIDGLEAIEFKAIHEYLKQKPETQIFPFDWSGKQVYMAKNNYWSKIESMNIRLKEYFSAGQIDTFSAIILEAFSDFSQIDNLIGDEDLKTINQSFVRKTIELKNKWEYEKLIVLANANPHINQVVPTLKLGLDYWNTRNKEMALNILNILIQFPNKKILVQTGNYHKYYLFNELEGKQKQHNFSILEYWEK